MIESPFMLSVLTSVEAAKRELNARRINAAPVTGIAEGGEGQVVGAVTRQLLDGALQHGLGDRPVEIVMEQDLVWVDPDAPAEEVGERMLSRHPRFILVGDAATGRPRGIVTRMQVLRYLQGRIGELAAPNDRADRVDRVDLHAARQPERHAPVGDLLRALPTLLLARILSIASVSRRHGLPVYLVGGFVRDLLLGRENRDLDLVALGDGPHFARLLAAELGGKVRVHPAFLTAVVIDPEGFEIDVVTARSEFYRAPAALPEVQTSPLRQDLYRRDFTINTLAICLGPEETPELVDYFGGRKDLRGKTLRVLHSLSFLDDPTRAFRAVRFELRLGFRMAAGTARLLGVALGLGAFDRLSGSRLTAELALLLEEPGLAERGVERLAELGLLRVLHPALELDDGARERLRQARAAYDWYRMEGLNHPPVAAWRLLLLALTRELPEADRAALADRLLLAGEDRRLLLGFPARLGAAARLLRRRHLAPHEAPLALTPHEAHAALAPLAGEELLLLLASGDESSRAWVRRDLTSLRGLALTIRGADLVASGVPPGPKIGQALAATRQARLDGRIEAAGELAYALAALAEGA